MNFLSCDLFDSVLSSFPILICYASDTSWPGLPQHVRRDHWAVVIRVHIFSHSALGFILAAAALDGEEISPWLGEGGRMRVREE